MRWGSWGSRCVTLFLGDMHPTGVLATTNIAISKLLHSGFSLKVLNIFDSNERLCMELMISGLCFCGRRVLTCILHGGGCLIRDPLMSANVRMYSRIDTILSCRLRMNHQFVGAYAVPKGLASARLPQSSHECSHPWLDPIDPCPRLSAPSSLSPFFSLVPFSFTLGGKTRGRRPIPPSNSPL